MKTVKWIIIFSLLALVGFVIYKAVESSKIETILTVNAQFRDIERAILVPGTIMPSKEIEIKSNISGVLDQLLVQVGETVRQGQIIARIRMETNPTELRHLQRRMEVATTQYKNSQINYQRNKHLFEQRVIALVDFEREEMAFLLAKAEYEAVMAEWLMAANFMHAADTVLVENIQNMVITTESGTLLELPIRTGGSVMARGTFSEGTTIARIAKLDALIFRGYVAEADVSALREGMHIMLIVSALDNQKIPAKLRLIAPKGIVQDGITRFEIEADVLIPKDFAYTIRAGFTANAQIIVQQKENVLSLEERHFSFSRDSIFVETKNENGRWQKTTIKTGISDGIYTEIISGLDSTIIIKQHINN